MKASLSALLFGFLGGCTTAAHAPAISVHHAVSVSLPASVVMDQVHHSVTLTPTLVIQNTSGDTLGIVHFGGGWLNNVSVAFEVVDAAGKKIPAIETVSLHSTLAGTRVWVSLLRPGESIAWNPDEATSFSIAQKGNYRLIAHVQIAVPETQFEVGIADSERLQITDAVHSFDSGAVAFSVE